MSDVTFKVSGQSESPARLAVQVRGFELIVDEPPGLGGDDEGPNPVEYILAGLAGCLNVMGHIIAKEMGFTIRSLTIDAAGPLNPKKLLGKQTDDRMTGPDTKTLTSRSRLTPMSIRPPWTNGWRP